MSINPRELKLLKTGTTTVGVQCSDGIVLATDRRVTSGYYIAHRRGKKIHFIDKHVAVTIAGAVSDAQRIVDNLKAEASLYRLEKSRNIRIASLASLASTLLFEARPFIYIVQLIIGGVDDTGPALYAVDWFGSITKEKYIATGSGTHLALAILDSGFRPEMSVKETLPLALKAVEAAMRIDPGSGEGIDSVIITREESRMLSDEEIKKYLSKTVK
ncbi:MAG: proteasome subunit beta [Thermoprotei archaeon]|nr:MAG: proteasome subunit beta [Thermoprotei archaeon]